MYCGQSSLRHAFYYHVGAETVDGDIASLGQSLEDGESAAGGVNQARSFHLADDGDMEIEQVDGHHGVGDVTAFEEHGFKLASQLCTSLPCYLDAPQYGECDVAALRYEVAVDFSATESVGLFVEGLHRFGRLAVDEDVEQVVGVDGGVVVVGDSHGGVVRRILHIKVAMLGAASREQQHEDGKRQQAGMFCYHVFHFVQFFFCQGRLMVGSSTDLKAEKKALAEGFSLP